MLRATVGGKQVNLGWFATAEEELLHLFCELEVDGIFAENVDVAVRVGRMGCPDDEEEAEEPETEEEDVLDAEDRKRSRRRSSAGNQQFTSHGHGLAHRCALPYVVGSSLFPCVRRDEVPCGCVDAGSGPWRTRSAIVSGTLCSTY